MQPKSYLDVFKINFLILMCGFFIITFLLEPGFFITLVKKLGNVGYGRIAYSLILALPAAAFLSFFNMGDVIVYSNINKEEILSKLEQKLKEGKYVKNEEKDNLITFTPSWKKSLNFLEFIDIDNIYIDSHNDKIRIIGPKNTIKRKFKNVL